MIDKDVMEKVVKEVQKKLPKISIYEIETVLTIYNKIVNERYRKALKKVTG